MVINVGKTETTVREVSHRFMPDVRREGAGTLITRWIIPTDIRIADPFLLFDQTRSSRVDEYAGGFPEHPHRGFEALTYVLSGGLKHRDSAGYEGDIGPLGAQWLTNASGLTHDEIPGQTDGLFWCLQLWINLPAANKSDKPFYVECRGGDIPAAGLPDGGTVRVIAGEYQGMSGLLPPCARPSEPVYLDISLTADSDFTYQPPAGFTVLLFCIDGKIHVGKNKSVLTAEDMAALETTGDVLVKTSEDSGRLLLIAGKPINEKIAWHGPFVMNTDRELGQAFLDYARFGPFRRDTGTGQGAHTDS